MSLVLINSVECEAVANYFLHSTDKTKASNKRKEVLSVNREKTSGTRQVKSE